MLAPRETFTVLADIHEAGHKCDGTVLQVPWGHARLPQELVFSCGLDTPTLTIQSDEHDLRRMTLTVYLDGPRKEYLEVGIIYFCDRYLRPEGSEFVPFVYIPGPHWPMATVNLELTESFDMMPHAGQWTAPPLILEVSSRPIIG